MYCSSWGHKESDRTERLKNSEPMKFISSLKLYFYVGDHRDIFCWGVFTVWFELVLYSRPESLNTSTSANVFSAHLCLTLNRWHKQSRQWRVSKEDWYHELE